MWAPYERICLIRFLAGCRKSRLNQVCPLSYPIILGFFLCSVLFTVASLIVLHYFVFLCSFSNWLFPKTCCLFYWNSIVYLRAFLFTALVYLTYMRYFLHDTRPIGYLYAMHDVSFARCSWSYGRTWSISSLWYPLEMGDYHPDPDSQTDPVWNRLTTILEHHTATGIYYFLIKDWRQPQ